jgi:hypothetical protein
MLTVLLQQALTELANLQPGEVFLVRDLFKGYEWNRISRANRLKLGTMFLAQVTAQGASYSIKVLNKTSANQQQYQKQ